MDMALNALRLSSVNLSAMTNI